MKQFYIYSHEYNLYYRENSKGYTEEEEEAGKFFENTADAILNSVGVEKKLEKIPVFDFVEWICSNGWIAESETDFFKERENITVSIWIKNGFVNAAIKDTIVFKKCLIPTTKLKANIIFESFRIM